MISQKKMLSSQRVLIVGAGLTGSLTAALLRRRFNQDIDLIVWDKSRGAGGRMNTKRQSGCPGLSVDMGAQYISATKEFFESHKGFYEELLTSSVLAPFNGVIEGEKNVADMKHFIAPGGINTVAKHFLHSAEAVVQFGTHCSKMNIVQAGADNLQHWQAVDITDNSVMIDTVIVTTPVPQLLKLEGSVQHVLESKRQFLEEVKYSSRYALALYYAPDTNIHIPWTAKYIHGDPCVRFVCVDSKKRGKDPSEFGTSILVHTSVPFGIQHLDMDTKEVEVIISHHFRELFPDLPRPSATYCHRWRYSQVSRAFDGTPGCVVLNESPLLIACGDAFVQRSNFDGCVESALSLVKTFSELNNTKGHL